MSLTVVTVMMVLVHHLLAVGPRYVIVRGCTDPVHVEIKGTDLNDNDQYAFILRDTYYENVGAACSGSTMRIAVRASAPDVALGRVNTSAAQHLLLCHRSGYGIWNVLNIGVSVRHSVVVRGSNTGTVGDAVHLAPHSGSNCFILSAVKYSEVVLEEGAVLLVGAEGYGTPHVSHLVMYSGAKVASPVGVTDAVLRTDAVVFMSRGRKPIKVFTTLLSSDFDASERVKVLLNDMGQLKLDTSSLVEGGDLRTFRVRLGTDIRRKQPSQCVDPAIEWNEGQVVVTGNASVSPSMPQRTCRTERPAAAPLTRLGTMRCARLAAEVGADVHISALSVGESGRAPAGLRGVFLDGRSVAAVDVFSGCASSCILNLHRTSQLRVGEYADNNPHPSVVANVQLEGPSKGGLLLLCGNVRHSIPSVTENVELAVGHGVQELSSEIDAYFRKTGSPKLVVENRAERVAKTSKGKRSPWASWGRSQRSSENQEYDYRASPPTVAPPTIAPPEPVPMTMAPATTAPPIAAQTRPEDDEDADHNELAVITVHTDTPETITEPVRWNISQIRSLRNSVVFHAPVVIYGVSVHDFKHMRANVSLTFYNDVTFESNVDTCSGAEDMVISNDITFVDSLQERKRVEIIGCVQFAGTVRWQMRNVGTITGTPTSGLRISGLVYTTDSNPKVQLSSLHVLKGGELRFPSHLDRDSLAVLEVRNFVVDGVFIANSSIDMEGMVAGADSHVTFGSTADSTVYVYATVSGNAVFKAGSTLVAEYPSLIMTRLKVFGDLYLSGKVIFHDKESADLRSVSFGSYIVVLGALHFASVANLVCKSEYIRFPDTVKDACVHPFMRWGTLEGEFTDTNIHCSHQNEPLLAYIEQDSLFLLPQPRVPTANLLLGLGVVLCMALLAACSLRVLGSWHAAYRAVVSRPPMYAYLNITDSSNVLSLNAFCCAAIALECLWLGTSTLHPYIRVLMLNHLSEDVQLLLFMTVCVAVGVCVPLWWRMRQRLLELRAEYLQTAGIEDLGPEMWSADSFPAVIECFGLRAMRQAAAVSTAGSILLIPCLLVLLRPMQCVLSEHDSVFDAVHVFSSTCPESYPLTSLLPLGIVFALLLCWMVIDSGTFSAAPLRHIVFTGCDVRTKRSFDAGRVFFVAAQIVTMAVCDANAGTLLSLVAVVQGMYLAWTLLTTPSVYDNVNRLRASAQIMSLWTVCVARASILHGDPHVLLCVPRGGMSVVLVVVWLLGCAGWVGVLQALWTKYLRPEGDVGVEGGLDSSRRKASFARSQDVDLFALPYYLCVATASTASWCTTPAGTSPSDTTETSSTDIYKKWTKGRLLGRGAFGSVHLGILQNCTLVAVKIVDLRDEGQASDAEIAKLEKEVNFMRKLQHPNVIKYKACEFNEKRRRIYIFMEYAVGGSLTSLVKACSARLSEAVAAQCIRQMLCGLAFLHENNVVHRDIKGENVLLDSEGCIKLADFGCARDIATCTMSNSFAGTPYWAAPEVFKNGFNKKADIWSVGCTAVEVLTRFVKCGGETYSMDCLKINNQTEGEPHGHRVTVFSQ